MNYSLSEEQLVSRALDGDSGCGPLQLKVHMISCILQPLVVLETQWSRSSTSGGTRGGPRRNRESRLPMISCLLPNSPLSSFGDEENHANFELCLELLEGHMGRD
ncbi:hypothetical protein ACJIZ3_010683 [Penstemon smallii]|uniref:Uncharacterized protein n=1 Tax=Penstemon smallii TaxID=265156 RepID=A0ABD3UIL4_9LAMI